MVCVRLLLWRVVGGCVSVLRWMVASYGVLGGGCAMSMGGGVGGTPAGSRQAGIRPWVCVAGFFTGGSLYAPARPAYRVVGLLGFRQRSQGYRTPAASFLGRPDDGAAGAPPRP